MDEADRADQEIEMAIAERRRIAHEQAIKAPAFRPRGACHFCDEPVGAEMLFCDRACAEDQAAEEEQLKRLGRR
jgi:hypothetical protein